VGLERHHLRFRGVAGSGRGRVAVQGCWSTGLRRSAVDGSSNCLRPAGRPPAAASGMSTTMLRLCAHCLASAASRQAATAIDGSPLGPGTHTPTQRKGRHCSTRPKLGPSPHTDTVLVPLISVEATTLSALFQQVPTSPNHAHLTRGHAGTLDPCPKLTSTVKVSSAAGEAAKPRWKARPSTGKRPRSDLVLLETSAMSCGAE